MIIKIKVEALPLHFLILGGFLIVYALLNLLAAQAIILNSILLLIGTLLLTSHQALLVNTTKKVYSEFYWVLGMKLSNYTEAYTDIISLTCVTGNYSQQYGKYVRRFIQGTMFKGFIELSNQENLFVGQNKSKKTLILKLNKISVDLGVPVKEIIEGAD